MNISKEQFIKIMESIQQQLNIDIKNNEAFSTILENDFVSSPKNILYDILINFLIYLTNDESKWIDYFIYELDFGKENDRLQVYDVDENKIDLITKTGFFFGDTDYDEWYLENLTDTIKIIKYALSLPENYEFFYRSSW